MFTAGGWSWKRLAVFLVGLSGLILLARGGMVLAPDLGLQDIFPFISDTAADQARPVHPVTELMKLVAAGFVGIVVTVVRGYTQRDRPLTISVEHAQILLCIAAALMMIIIGNSVARALGIAGGASIVRFRTPVADPKDAVIFIILLGLGMSCGVGAFAVAALGTIFLCLFLVLLAEFGGPGVRRMMLELVSARPEFPVEHVQNVFAAYQIQFEPREVTEGREPVHKYWVMLPSNTSLEFLMDHLLAGGEAGIKAVSWGKEAKR